MLCLNGLLLKPRSPFDKLWANGMAFDIGYFFRSC